MVKAFGTPVRCEPIKRTALKPVPLFKDIYRSLHRFSVPMGVSLIDLKVKKNYDIILMLTLSNEWGKEGSS